MKFLQHGHEPYLQSFTHIWSAPQWGADVVNNNIPWTGELCTISTALHYSPPVSGIPPTHTHTQLIILSKLSKSTLFLEFVYCLYSRKELFQTLDLFPSWSERLERHLQCCVRDKQLFSAVGQSMPVTLLYIRIYAPRILPVRRWKTYDKNCDAIHKDQKQTQKQKFKLILPYQKDNTKW